MAGQVRSVVLKIWVFLLSIMHLASQGSYSLTLCRCLKDGHIHLAWTQEHATCCQGPTRQAPVCTSGAEADGALCCKAAPSPNSGNCCEHTTFKFQKSDPAASLSSKKTQPKEELLPRPGAGEVLPLFVVGRIGKIPSGPSGRSELAGSSSRFQAWLSVWRN